MLAKHSSNTVYTVTMIQSLHKSEGGIHRVHVIIWYKDLALRL